MKTRLSAVCRMTVLIICLSLLLSGCTLVRDFDIDTSGLPGFLQQEDDFIEEFFYNADATDEVINMDFGEGSSAVYYLSECYGIWTHDGVERIIYLHGYSTEQGCVLTIYAMDLKDICYAMKEMELRDNYILLTGDPVFEGLITPSVRDRKVTFAPSDVTLNKMSEATDHTVVMTESTVPTENIIDYKTALTQHIPGYDAYLEWIDGINNSEIAKLGCEALRFRVDGKTMTGEWQCIGATVPISVKIYNTVPYIEIYDTEQEDERILYSIIESFDESTITLKTHEGAMVDILRPDTVVIEIERNGISE